MIQEWYPDFLDQQISNTKHQCCGVVENYFSEPPNVSELLRTPKRVETRPPTAACGQLEFLPQYSSGS